MNVCRLSVVVTVCSGCNWHILGEIIVHKIYHVCVYFVLLCKLYPICNGSTAGHRETACCVLCQYNFWGEIRESIYCCSVWLYIKALCVTFWLSEEYDDHLMLSLWRLVHAFITSRIDGCNTVLARSPRTITDRLQRLLHAAARVVSNTGKFDRGLTHLLHSGLHWLDVPQRILHKLGVTVHRCLQVNAPQYLVNCCHPTLDVASCQRLRSSSRHHLVVPRHRRSMLGRRAFSVAGPMAWNVLPDDLWDPSLSADNFRKTLKTHLFRNALGHLAH